jgi:hypothetical protein
MPEPREHPHLTELEAALHGLQPRADLDRPALWYHAGRASVRRGWAWPLATGMSLALAAVCCLLLLTRPAAERVVYVHVPPPVRPPEPEPPSPAPEPGAPFAVAVPETTVGALPGSLRLREQVLRWGLDGLPMPQEPSSSAPADTPAHFLRAP